MKKYGFNILKGVNPCYDTNNAVSFEDYILQNCMIHKFQGDKFIFENDEYIICLDGLILNGKVTPLDLIYSYELNGDTFFDSLRGVFAGFLFIKSQRRIIIFSDQLGQKFIYYYNDNGKFICSLMINEIYETLKYNNIPYDLDVENASLMLANGSMIEDKTLCTQIKKIRPGAYIVYQDGIVTEKHYYKLKNESTCELSEDEIIDKIDFLFKQAVKRQFEKDNQYGYKHIVALSGGLDCRMTSWVANELGYTDQLNCTFSQTGYYDQKVPMAMAEFLKHEWLFKSLDNGVWLEDIDDCIRMTGGNIVYTTIAHTNSLYKYVNFDDLGLLHSGQLGDVTIATHEKTKCPYGFGDGAYSPRLAKELNIETENFPNKEIGLFYHRYLTATNNGLQNLYPYTETMSPFLDLDFFEFALTIPESLRFNHNLYKKWILKYHPDAAKFEWEKLGAKISAITINIGHRQVAISTLPKRIFRKIFIRKDNLNTKHNMNPFGYYITHNEELRLKMESYETYLYNIKDNKLRERLVFNLKSSKPSEMFQAITLLGAVKLYFS